MSEILFNRLVLIGMGLIGSSIARAARKQGVVKTIVATARSPQTRQRVQELGIADEVVDSNAAAVKGADLVIVCIPVGQSGRSGKGNRAASEARGHLCPMSARSKARCCGIWPRICPQGVHFVPGHPVAGTEYSGPDAGFAELFVNRWCILTPPEDADTGAVERLAAFWGALGANVETMPADHHDLVLGITSHLPHLIAYTIVGTADELSEVTRSEVLKFSAGGFRDFTRIASSDPTMWRDIFIANKDAVLEMLGRFNEDLVGAYPRHAQRRRSGAVRPFHAYPRDPPRHRGDRAGFSRTRISGGRIRIYRKRRQRKSEQRIDRSDRQVAKEHRTVVDPERKHDRAAAFQLCLFAEQPDAGRDASPGMFARDVTETRRQAVERGGKAVNLAAGRYQFVHAKCRQQPIEPRHGNEQLAIEMAIIGERQRAGGQRDQLALLRACMGDVDAPADSMHFAKAIRPRLRGKIFQSPQHESDLSIERGACQRIDCRRRGVVQPQG